MTARVCPVHGEYAPTGICRWCEPETLLDVALSGPKVRPLPVAEPTPWAKKPSGAGQSSIWLPLLCCCKTCLRTFDALIPLTSLLCPECRGKAQPTSTDVVGESPGARALLDVKHIAEMLGDPHPRWDPAPTYMGVPVVVDPHMSADAAPVLVSWTPIEKTDEAYGWRLEWTAPVPPGPELNADKERRLAAEHAALRWERVARRWAAKGPTPPRHRLTVDGEIAFDDHCATCRQVRDKLIKAWFPKEWP